MTGSDPNQLFVELPKEHQIANNRCEIVTLKRRIQCSMIIAGIASLLAVGCASQEELTRLRLGHANMPQALQEPVMTMELRKRDVRKHRLKGKHRTALLVYDPVLVAWLRFNSNKLWTFDFLPDDHEAIDISQRAVVVQVWPVRSLWEQLSETPLPANWRPVTDVELRRAGKYCESIELNRLPKRSPTAQMAVNHGYYGFEPACFSAGESVEFIIRRGDDSEVLPVPDALQGQLERHFSIFDSAMTANISIHPPETALR